MSDLETLPAPVTDSSTFHVKPPEWDKVDKVRFTFLQTIYTVTETVALHPLTVAQTIAELDKVKVVENLSWSDKAKQSFKNNLGIIESFKKITPSSTFRGYVSAGLTAFPITCAYYQIYDMIAFLPYMKIKEEISKSLGEKYQDFAPFFAGMTTALPISLIGNPIGVLSRHQIKLRVEGKPYDLKSTFQYVVRGPSLIPNDPPGLHRLYRGFLGCTFSIPLMGCSWMFYESAHSKIKTIFNTTHLWASFAAGCWAGGVCAAMWRPIGVVVARKQVAGGEGMGAANTYSSICKELLREEGIGAFFKGLGARVMSSGPRSGVFYSCYAIFSTWAMGSSADE